VVCNREHFSTVGTLKLGNVRQEIPLQIDDDWVTAEAWGDE
jgi:hypothetical protein